MSKKDPRVDAYIQRAAKFAQPVLKHLRQVIHAACPGVEETMKWNTPFFMHHGILCSMAAFKQHCRFGFWKGSLVLGDTKTSKPAMKNYGSITKLSDLPPKATLARYVRKAAQLNEDGIDRPTKPRAKKKKPVVPKDLAAALARNKKAAATFEGFSPSHQREYVRWISGAKADETRQRRLDTAIQWLAQGKARNWKYARQ